MPSAFCPSAVQTDRQSQIALKRSISWIILISRSQELASLRLERKGKKSHHLNRVNLIHTWTISFVWPLCVLTTTKDHLVFVHHHHHHIQAGMNVYTINSEPTEQQEQTCYFMHAAVHGHTVVETPVPLLCNTKQTNKHANGWRIGLG